MDIVECQMKSGANSKRLQRTPDEPISAESALFEEWSTWNAYSCLETGQNEPCSALIDLGEDELAKLDDELLALHLHALAIRGPQNGRGLAHFAALTSRLRSGCSTGQELRLLIALTHYSHVFQILDELERLAEISVSADCQAEMPNLYLRLLVLRATSFCELVNTVGCDDLVDLARLHVVSLAGYANSIGYHETQLRALYLDIDLMLADSKLHAAEKAMLEVEKKSLVPENFEHHSLHHSRYAQLCAQKGEFEQALYHAQLNIDFIHFQQRSPTHRDWEQHVIAHMLTGKWDVAEKVVLTLQGAEGGQNTSLQLLGYMAQLRRRNAAYPGELALSFLRLVTELSQRSRVVLQCKSALSEAINCAMETGELVQACIMQINRLKLLPPTQPSPNWPWPLKICLLGDFQLLQWGRPLGGKGMPKGMPLELLKLLAVKFLGFQSRQGVSAEEITEYLWPNSETRDPKKLVEINIHRLRRVIGENAIEVKEGRVRLNPGTVCVDAESLFCPPDSGAEADGRILAMYRGRLLSNESLPDWAQACADRAETSFVLALRREVQRLENLGLRSKALGLINSVARISHRAYLSGLEALRHDALTLNTGTSEFGKI